MPQNYDEERAALRKKKSKYISEGEEVAWKKLSSDVMRRP